MIKLSMTLDAMIISVSIQVGMLASLMVESILTQGDVLKARGIKQ